MKSVPLSLDSAVRRYGLALSAETRDNHYKPTYSWHLKTFLQFLFYYT